eukprot:CAMPEP_0173413030 /NCGR_PEP_ID=MMETSP1356-20130122/80986_1 /TAXON_ID=77927 ORGANISM="Hemiselmis virescens, Strain PCC157" /NCGR_SAMPLE_ID=MMETSP1356 /ASSEMBLY_ACC=CAM_ASM_000847 /LENGTH=30 /DNA_ID= /DNA_START= /DNA_END= /DNA_ORIENTATION=
MMLMTDGGQSPRYANLDLTKSLLPPDFATR